jgi:hypothetical protein
MTGVIRVRDIRVSKDAEENIAELQTITVERLAEVWKYEKLVTQRQRRAADKYYGLWTHARGRRGYSLADLAEFPRAARRDEDLCAACSFLVDFIDEKARRWLWREARAAMGRAGNVVDEVVLHGQFGDVAVLRAGLNRLVEHFADKRWEWSYELELFMESTDVAAARRGYRRDAGVSFGPREGTGSTEATGRTDRRHAARAR